MTRDLVLVACILVCLGFSFRHPFAGILTWGWIALMQPHTEVYGVISNTLRLNLLVAIVTLLAWLVSKERKLQPLDNTVVIIAMFLVWITFNCFFAVDPDWTWQQWNRDWRIILFGLLVWATVTNRNRVHALIWVIAASFLYYGVKSGLLTIMAGGAKKIMGPSQGMYADNNQFALALLMVLPLVNYLRMQTENRYLRIGLVGGFALSFLAVLGSYSRGAFVALMALGVVWWLRSRNKLLYLIFAAFLAVPTFEFMPQSYYARLSTINSAESDGSFEGRVTAWKVAFDYARDHFPIGAGLDGPQNPKVFNHYFPTQPYRAAHSIYFQVLGDNGFAGLAIYLVLIALVFVNCSRVRKAARDRPEFSWARDLATAIQLSMVAFCVGGAALSLAYSDFLFIWAGLLSRILALVQQPQMQGFQRNSFAAQGYPVPAIAMPSMANRNNDSGTAVHA